MDCWHNAGHRESVPWLMALPISTSSFPPSMYQTKAVIIAMIITAVVSISVTIFCFQTKVRMGRALPRPLCPLTYTHLWIWAGMGRPRPLQARGFPSLISCSRVSVLAKLLPVCVLSLSLSLLCP